LLRRLRAGLFNLSFGIATTIPNYVERAGRGRIEIAQLLNSSELVLAAALTIAIAKA
jgi:hypothetical protein